MHKHSTTRSLTSQRLSAPGFVGSFSSSHFYRHSPGSSSHRLLPGSSAICLAAPTPMAYAHTRTPDKSPKGRALNPPRLAPGSCECQHSRCRGHRLSSCRNKDVPNRLGSWLPISVNILKPTELYTISGWAVWRQLFFKWMQDKILCML